MAGRLVNVTQFDSIRFDILGAGRAVTIPASVLLAADTVLRYCIADDSGLDLDMVEDDATGWTGWEARCEHPNLETDADTVLVAHGDTPWGAIVALANAIEAARAR